MFAQPCEYIKSQFILYFNWVNCMVCALYLNKVVWFLKKEAVRLEGTNTALATDVYICVAIRKPRLDPISALAMSPAASLKPIFLRSSVSCIKTSAQNDHWFPTAWRILRLNPPFQPHPTRILCSKLPHLLTFCQTLPCVSVPSHIVPAWNSIHLAYTFIRDKPVQITPFSLSAQLTARVPFSGSHLPRGLPHFSQYMHCLCEYKRVTHFLVCIFPSLSLLRTCIYFWGEGWVELGLDGSLILSLPNLPHNLMITVNTLKSEGWQETKWSFKNIVFLLLKVVPLRIEHLGNRGGHREENKNCPDFPTQR